MPSGVVLVIEDDEWVARLLGTAIREAGYEVTVQETAAAGLTAACAQEPEAIVCDVDLPDHDGFWVARNVRMQPSRVSVTPFLFLSGLDDHESRLQGFHVGGDVYMTKPFRVAEVVAQIGALVQMASRLRQRRESLISIPPAAAQTAIEGDLSQMSVATVLTVLEMERRSGIFEVVSKKRRAQLEIADGSVKHGLVGGTRVPALAALRSMLTWKVGRFSFHPCPTAPPSERRSIAAYLLEASRLEDEATRAALDLPPSRRRPEPRLATTALGGPAPTPDDLAPPSSRALRPPVSSLDAALITLSEGMPPDLTLEAEPAPPSGPWPSPASLRALARDTIVAAPPHMSPPPPLPPPPARPPSPPRRVTPPPAPLAPPRPAPRQPPRPDASSKKR